jgi:hypothetical protein
MSWHDLLAFIRTRDASYLDSVRGVSPQDVALCEQNCAIELPRLYVGFLTTMGEDTGAFWPFGARQNCRFYDLIEMLPAEDYPGSRFFKIAFEDDPSAITHYDLFLDLARSDGEDAALVRFEDSGAFAHEGVHEVGFTLQEWFNARFFDYFEVYRRPRTRTVFISPPPASGVEQCMRQALGLLSKMGLESALPLMPRVACLGGSSLSASVELHETTRGVSVDLGADDPTELRVTIEQLVDGLPGARAVEWESPRSGRPGD